MTRPGPDAVESMNREALIAAWTKLFQHPVPKGISQPWMRRFIAFETQARRYGGLPKGFVADLDRHVAKLRQPSSPTLKPGARLLREWNGAPHIVEVTETGFLWNGVVYASLSSVARAITGARWSGPRFFGLKDGS